MPSESQPKVVQIRKMNTQRADSSKQSDRNVSDPTADLGQQYNRPRYNYFNEGLARRELIRSLRWTFSDVPEAISYERDRGLLDIDSRINKLETFKEYQEFLNDSAIRPVLSKVTRALESTAHLRELPAPSTAQSNFYIELPAISEAAVSVITEFDDLLSRLAHYTAFQKRLRNLLESTKDSNDRDFRAAILILHDATHSIYSEDLSLDQVQCLHKSTSRLQEVLVSREEVRHLDKVLLNAGFETIPSDRATYSRDD